MPRPYLGDPKYTIEVLQKYNFAFQKRFGQNFLIDTHVLDKIIDSAQITKDDFVLEIGPGIGTMTQYLAEAAREVAAVEIDKTLLPILDDTLSSALTASPETKCPFSRSSSAKTVSFPIASSVTKCNRNCYPFEVDSRRLIAYD